MQRAWQYLNPAIASTSVLFREINRDTGKFTNFLVKSSNLVTTIAQRRNDLSGLVRHLATTTEALASQKTALGQSIQRLPGFMALADTTFVNLRNALDDVKPARRRLEAGGAEAPEAARPAQAAGRGLGADGPRPRQHHPPAGCQQRPHRARPARRPARPGHGPQCQRRRQEPPRCVPAVGHRAQRLDPRAGHRPAVRGRPHRLVRGIHASGLDRRQRRHQPRRPGVRPHLDRGLADAADSDRPHRLPAPVPGRRLAEREGAADDRAGRPVPGLDGARRRPGTPRSGFPCNPSQVPTGP